MGHADRDFGDAVAAAIFDDAFERGDGAFAAVEAEALRPDIFLGEEFFPLLAVDDLLEDGLLAVLGEADLGLLALHPLLEKAALLKVVDVHIFEADGAAIVCLEHGHEFAHGRLVEAHRAAEPDPAIEIGIGEAVVGGREVGGQVAVGEAERVELGGEVAAYSIGADQHHRADAVLGGVAYRALVDDARSGCGRFANLGGNLRAPAGFAGFWRRLGRVEPGVGGVEFGQRPVRSRPAGARLGLQLWLEMRVHDQPFNSSVRVVPSSDGLGLTLIPAASIAAIFDPASPLPPETIAPA